MRLTADDVTVVIAARDAAATLAASVTSVLDQTAGRPEVVVVDDGSTDATSDVARDLGVHVLRLPSSVGRAEARNTAIRESTRSLIAVQDADDVARPERLAATLPLLDGDVVAAGGQACFRDPRWGSWLLTTYPTTDAGIRAALADGSIGLCHPTALLDRAAVLAVGGYRPRYPRSQDLDLVRRLAAVGALAASPEVLVDYTHPVRLPYRYWAESRRCALAVVTDTDPAPLPLAQRLRYPVAQARRAVAFTRTRGCA